MDEYKEEGVSRDLRERAYLKRFAFIENIESHLLTLERSLTANHIDVAWASGEGSLTEILTSFLPQQNYNRVCIDCKKIPQSFINQSDVIKSYSVEEVIKGGSDITTLIVDSDFAIAETGELVFFDRPSTACFNSAINLIVIVNIDQVMVSRQDLSLFSYLRGKNNTFSTSVTLLQQPFDVIVPDEFQSSQSKGYTIERSTIHVVFYENNVSSILTNALLRESLYCIQCGKCMEVCPVAKAGQSLSPIDMVKQNCIEDFSRTKQIYQQTTLCGNCQSVCPVNIPLTDLLIYEMGLINSKDKYTKNKRLFSIFSKRSKMNKYNSRFLRWFFIKKFFGKNKTLNQYFETQSGDFYNIIRQNSEYQDE